MRISRRTVRVVRAVVPFIRGEVGTVSPALVAAAVTPKDRALGREILRRDLARRARADIATYWAMRANDGGER